MEELTARIARIESESGAYVGTKAFNRAFIASYPESLRPVVRKAMAVARRSYSLPMWIDDLDGSEFHAANDGYLLIASY